jgi:hypothetical protein
VRISRIKMSISVVGTFIGGRGSARKRICQRILS